MNTPLQKNKFPSSINQNQKSGFQRLVEIVSALTNWKYKLQQRREKGHWGNAGKTVWDFTLYWHWTIDVKFTLLHWHGSLHLALQTKISQRDTISSGSFFFQWISHLLTFYVVEILSAQLWANNHRNQSNTMIIRFLDSQAFYVISLLFMLVSLCAAQSAITTEILSNNPNHPQDVRSLKGENIREWIEISIA